MTNTTLINANTEQNVKSKEIPSLAEADLRDYFAAKALQGILAFPGNPAWGDVTSQPVEKAAMRAYDLADAMLAERAK